MPSVAALCPYLWGRELGGDAPIGGGGEELFPQDGLELLGQDLLLLHAAVVLQGQDHRVVRSLGSNVHSWRSASVGLGSSLPSGQCQEGAHCAPLCPPETFTPLQHSPYPISPLHPQQTVPA